MRRLLAFFALLCLAALAASPARAQKPGQAVPGTEGVGLDQRLGQKVPLDLAFTDENGQPVTLGTYAGQGKPILLTLAYYDCPMLCSVVLDGLSAAVRKVPATPGVDYTLVTVSFSPTETVEQAQRQKARHMTALDRPGTTDGWHFLTGPQAASTRLADAVGFRYRWDEASQQYAHPATLVFLAPDGTITRYLPGVAFDPLDVRLALSEASEGKVGGIVESFLMLCFAYSPHEATYTVSVMKALRLAGVATVLGLGLLVRTLYRRHASQPPVPIA